MPPKKSGKDTQKVEEKNVVQALVVVDTFDDEFLPMTNDIPLALFPVINRPLIEYTLEFLRLGGIQETILFCCKHVEAIREYINQLKAKPSVITYRMNVIVTASETCRSFGDCLRDVYEKQLIKGNFVLIEPGVVGNFRILPIMEKHSEIAKRDKGIIQTLIYQGCGLSNKRSPLEQVVLATDENDRILFHKKLVTGFQEKVRIPTEILQTDVELNIRHNLRDTHISICSPEVLSLMADNFDYQTKDDFVKGLLMNEEILENTLYCHVLRSKRYKGNPSEYASAIFNWHMYQVVSRDVRYYLTSPIRCPDSTIKTGSLHFSDPSHFGKNCNIKEVEKIKKSMIGDEVQTGKNAIIEKSYVFPRTRIEDNAQVFCSVIGEDCILKSRSKILRCCVLGKGVVIEEKVLVPEYSLVQATRPENCTPEQILGEKAFIVKRSTDLEEDDALSKLKEKYTNLIEDPLVNKVQEEEEVYFSSTEDEEEVSRTQSPITDDARFLNEVLDSLTRGFEDKLPCANLILEINSSRYAYNINLQEVNQNVVRAILQLSFKEFSGSQQLSSSSHLLSYFCPILNHYIKKEEAMRDCMQALEDLVTSDEIINERWVTHILEFLYDRDIVTEEVLLEWNSNLDVRTRVKNFATRFFRWLEEAEEESD